MAKTAKDGPEVLMRRLTWREVRERIADPSIVYVVANSTEMHGINMPLGTDSYPAEAVAVMAAKLTGGVVLDPIPFSWPGCTKYNQATISMTMDLEKAYTRKVLETVPFMNNSDDFAFDSEFLIQSVYFGFRLADVPVPVRYFDEASSIDFTRSLRYGMETMMTLLKYIGATWGIRKGPIFRNDGKVNEP